MKKKKYGVCRTELPPVCPRRQPQPTICSQQGRTPLRLLVQPLCMSKLALRTDELFLKSQTNLYASPRSHHPESDCAIFSSRNKQLTTIWFHTYRAYLANMSTHILNKRITMKPWSMFLMKKGNKLVET